MRPIGAIWGAQPADRSALDDLQVEAQRAQSVGELLGVPDDDQAQVIQVDHRAVRVRGGFRRDRAQVRKTAIDVVVRQIRQHLGRGLVGDPVGGGVAQRRQARCKNEIAPSTSSPVNGAAATSSSSWASRTASTATSVRNDPCTAYDPPLRSGPKFSRTPYV